MEKIHANLVIEILGRPKEHLSQALATLVGKLETEQGITILNQTQHEPVKAKDAESLFTTFAEIEAEFESIEVYLQVLFAYMPSHAEIIKPEKIVIANTDLNELGNALVSRLHSYDAITKNVMAEREMLIQKIQEEAPELFKRLTAPPEPQQTPPEPKAKPSKAKKSTKKKN